MIERILGIILPVFSIIALGWLYAPPREARHGDGSTGSA